MAKVIPLKPVPGNYYYISWNGKEAQKVKVLCVNNNTVRVERTTRTNVTTHTLYIGELHRTKQAAIDQPVTL